MANKKDKKKRELPPLNQATPTLTGDVARKFLDQMEETSRKAEEFRTNHPEEHKKRMQKMKDDLEAILKKAKL